MRKVVKAGELEEMVEGVVVEMVDGVVAEAM